MSDGAIGSSHVTIPDLLEPVVGFRAFKVEAVEAKAAWDEVVWANNPYAEPFREPNEFVTDPISGKLIRDYKKTAEAFEKWQASLGKKKIIHHEAIEATAGCVKSPHREHYWSPGAMEAKCDRPLAHSSPHPTCQCGYYSYYDWEKLSVGGSQIIGIVTQWGGIEAHPTGMRSQYMKIEALLGGIVLRTLDKEWKEDEEAPILFYSSDVTREEFVELASEFGSPFPATMRPKETNSDAISRLMDPRFKDSTLRLKQKQDEMFRSFSSNYIHQSSHHMHPYGVDTGHGHWDLSNKAYTFDPYPRSKPGDVIRAYYKKPFDWQALWFCLVVLSVVGVLAVLLHQGPGAHSPSMPSIPTMDHQRVDFKAPLSSPTNFLLKRSQR